jgi:nitroimidazol reductase NimA-like FMN-containing flavoprotein (pyridoxamine 5'-phosphate oxidase superfamily)
VDPLVEQLSLPEVYGKPSKLLRWEDVRRDLEEAPVYWVASTRSDGRPHVVPRDGVWLDDTLYYGGSPETVHNRNLEHNPAVAVHIGDGMKAIVMEGEAEVLHPRGQAAQRLADANNTKYAHYGMNTKAETYTKRGTLAVRARRVIAWNVLFEDATRFTFPAAGP